MAESDRVADLLAEWHECKERGDEAGAASLEREHPELERHLAAARLLGEELRPASDDAPLPEGTPRTIGDYEIVREIGRGGMGVVYEAEQVSLRRRVALKVLSLTLGSSTQGVGRFEREARAAARLHHTNIVPIYAMGQHQGHWYYAMELVTGRPLDAIVREMRAARGEDGTSQEDAEKASGSEFSDPAVTNTGSWFARVARMFADVAEALDLAHEHGIVHRDVKPSNLLLDVDGTLKIVDFGLAQHAEGSIPSMTYTGQLIGTPIYMSPEQAMAKRIRVDHRTDIYSLGATLYEILTLRAPFEGKTLQELCSHIITKDPTLPRRLNQRVPRDLETIVMKAMEKDRDKRYATAAELARDLRAFAEGRGIAARPVGPLVRTWRRAKRHKVRTALVATVGVCAALAGLLGLRAVRQESLWRDVEYDRLVREGGEEAIRALALQRPEFQATPDSTTPSLDRAIALWSDRPEAWWMRALAPGRTVNERLADVDQAEHCGLGAACSARMRAFFLGLAGAERAAPESLPTVDEEPSDALDHYVEARIAYREGHLERTESHLTAAIESPMASDLVRVLAHRFRTLMHGAEPAKALEDYIALKRLGHDALAVDVGIAMGRLALGQAEEGKAGWARVLERAREDGRRDVWEWVWLRLRGLWETPDGRRTMPPLAERPLDLLLETVLAAREQHPDDVWLVWGHQAVLAETQGPQAALDVLDPFFERNPPPAAPARSVHFYPTVRGLRGMYLRRLGRLDEAIEAFEEAWKATGDDRSFGWDLASTLAQAGRDEEALHVWQELVAHQPTWTAARVQLWKQELDLGMDARAVLADIDAALEEQPEEAWYHAARADVAGRLAFDPTLTLPQQGSWSEESLASARAAIERAGSLDRLDRTQLLQAARVHEVRALSGLDRDAEVVDACKAALAEGAVSTFFFDKQALSLAGLGRLDEAVQIGEISVQHAATPRQRAYALLALAEVHLANREAEETLARLEEARALSAIDAQDQPVLERLWITSLLAVGRKDEAVEDAVALADAHPSSSIFLSLAAVACARAGRLDAALEYHDRWLALEPEGNAVPHENRAHLLRGLGRDLDEALRSARRALELEPTPSRYGLTFTLLYEMGRDAEALATVEEALARFPHPGFAHNAGWVALSSADPEVRDPERAAAHARRAIELGKDGPDTRALLGQALVAAGDAEAGREHLLAAQRMEGVEVVVACEIHLSLALAEAMLGHAVAGREALDRGLRLLAALPEDASAHGYLERLRDEATTRLQANAPK